MEVKKHSVPISILLHLVPGVINFIVFILLVGITDKQGLPNTIALYLMIIFSILIVQIGILLFCAKRTLGTYNILKLMPWFQKSKWWEYLLFIVILAVWSLTVSSVMTPIETQIQMDFFSFFPARLVVDNYTSSLSQSTIVLMAVLGFLTNGIIAPVVEELYFRGFLLPRIKGNENVAVILNAVLFSLYHLFSPWAFFSRIFMIIPIYFVVAKKKNLRFSIIAHIIANCFTSLSILALLFR